MPWIEASLAVLVVGGTVFYGLAAVAVARLLRAEPVSQPPPPRLTLLKPLTGMDAELESLLRSFFRLRPSGHELILGVHDERDPAFAAAQRLLAEYPDAPARIVVSGAPPASGDNANPKVHNLAAMASAATGDVLVISDSDILAADDYIERIAAEFDDPRVGVVTFPYCAVGRGLWSELEAVGANTEFWAGATTAQMLGPMDFAVGPTMAVRRACLDEIGGFDATRPYLAEDFVIGKWAAEKGWKVKLSSYVVEHRIGGESFAPNLRHRLRWHRSTRASRPLGYVAQAFTYPLPFAVALVAWSPSVWTWTLLGICAAMRVVAAVAVAGRLLGVRLSPRFWLLLPLQDAFSFAVWLAAFFGNRVEWRGRRFVLLRGGRLRAI